MLLDKTISFGPKFCFNVFFQIKIFLDPHFFSKKNSGPKIFLGPKIFRPKILLLPKRFLNQYFSGPKIFSDPKFFFRQNFFFSDPNYFLKFFLDPKSIQPFQAEHFTLTINVVNHTFHCISDSVSPTGYVQGVPKKLSRKQPIS